MSNPVQLDTDALKASIERALADVGGTDRRLIDDIRQLRETDGLTPENRRMYDEAIKALEKSRKQKAIPVRRRIAEAIVRLAAELELPLAVTDRPARRRTRARVTASQPPHHTSA